MAYMYGQTYPYPYPPNAYQYGQQTQQQTQLPHYEIIEVNGKSGVDAFQMGPNSKVILLDTSAPLIWVKQTDGNGFSTATPYSISQYKEEQPVDVKSLESRISRIEEMLNALSKPDTRNARKNESTGKSA